MITLNINIAEIAILLAIIVRLGIVLFMLPIFNSRNVSAPVKALIVVSLSIMLFPTVRKVTPPLPFDPAPLASLVISELIFGVIFALSILLLLSAFQLAGELIDFMIGFGFAQTAAPQGQGRSSVLASFAQLLAIMIFLSINGHLIVIRVLVESFKTIPVGSFALKAEIFTRMLRLSGLLFVLALKLAAPILSVLMLTQVGLGLMAKFAPQMNILATSFPLTITIGILFFGMTMTLWGGLATQSFEHLFHFLHYFSR